jgi:hypothetical protein
MVMKSERVRWAGRITLSGRSDYLAGRGRCGDTTTGDNGTVDGELGKARGTRNSVFYLLVYCPVAEGNPQISSVGIYGPELNSSQVSPDILSSRCYEKMPALLTVLGLLLQNGK